MSFHLSSILKILIATIIGGVIGFEREVINRPAGFRTHILVCVASAVVMDINILMSLTLSNIDPTRLGAQVVSGMGFLGAGTIIKEGPTVKGLTTAASLWAVACIGLAIGAGFYEIATTSAIVMLVTLKTFSQLENKITRTKRTYKLKVEVNDATSAISLIVSILGDFNCRIHKTSILHQTLDVIEIDYIPPFGFQNIEIIKKLESSTEIVKVEIQQAYQPITPA